MEQRAPYGREVRIRIGGPAGFGIKAAGATLARVFARAGYHTFDLTEYPSLIKGGHNTYHLRVSEDEIFSHVMPTDILVALDAATIPLHLERAHRRWRHRLRPERHRRRGHRARRPRRGHLPRPRAAHRDREGSRWRAHHAQRHRARRRSRPHGVPARRPARLPAPPVRAQSARDRRAEHRGRHQGLRARQRGAVRLPVPPDADRGRTTAGAGRRQRRRRRSARWPPVSASTPPTP